MDTSTLPSSADAYKTLQDFNSTRPHATDYINKANTQYNIPQDQEQVSGLQGAVNNLTQSLRAVAPSVQGRTAGTFTTAGQQSALINKEQAPIATNLTDTGTQLGTAQTNQGHDEQLASTLVQALLGDDNTKYQSLFDTYNSALGSEKEKEAEREYQTSQDLEKQKLAETTREFNLTPRGSAADSTEALIKALTGGGNTDSGSGLPPQLQALYKGVFFQPNGQKWDDTSLINDYNATSKSAGYGNANDTIKLQLYKAVRPDLFGGSAPFKNATATTPLTTSAAKKITTTPSAVAQLFGAKSTTKSTPAGNVFLGTY